MKKIPTELSYRLLCHPHVRFRVVRAVFCDFNPSLLSYMLLWISDYSCWKILFMRANVNRFHNLTSIVDFFLLFLRSIYYFFIEKKNISVCMFSCSHFCMSLAVLFLSDQLFERSWICICRAAPFWFELLQHHEVLDNKYHKVVEVMLSLAAKA